MYFRNTYNCKMFIMILAHIFYMLLPGYIVSFAVEWNNVEERPLKFKPFEASFTRNPDKTVTRIRGTNHTLEWFYDEPNGASVLVVVWKKDSKLLVSFDPLTKEVFYGLGYGKNKVSYISNGKIMVKNLEITDSGAYLCEVTYTTGATVTSETQYLTVIDELQNATPLMRNVVTLSPSSNPAKTFEKLKLCLLLTCLIALTFY